METFKDRIHTELDDLEIKLNKSLNFMHSEKFNSLDATNQGLLMVQLEYMQGYSKTLNRRLDAL